MSTEEVVVGNRYFCCPVGYTKEVAGEVIKKLDNCAIVQVKDCTAQDANTNQEKVGMAVAKYQTFHVAETEMV
jgi:hypothetical protein